MPATRDQIADRQRDALRGMMDYLDGVYTSDLPASGFDDRCPERLQVAARVALDTGSGVRRCLRAAVAFVEEAWADCLKQGEAEVRLSAPLSPRDVLATAHGALHVSEGDRLAHEIEVALKRGDDATLEVSGLILHLRGGRAEPMWAWYPAARDMVAQSLLEGDAGAAYVNVSGAEPDNIRAQRVAVYEWDSVRRQMVGGCRGIVAVMSLDESGFDPWPLESIEWSEYAGQMTPDEMAASWIVERYGARAVLVLRRDFAGFKSALDEAFVA